ncbi:MAG: ATP synthase F0 subunit B [Syntrophobacterales bacterium]|nr:ATP synthase F0 subunit B [Syntrophobacterales bacterium]
MKKEVYSHLILGIGLGVGLTSGLAWAAGGQAGAHELNWMDFTLRVINTGIVAAVLYKLLKKPTVTFFKSRQENIQKLLEEMEQKREEAERKCAEYKAKLALLDKEAEKILQEYIAQGEREKAKIIEAAERQANYIKQQARLAIQQEVKAAKDELREEVAELTVKAAEDILRQRMDMGDQERLVEEFLVKVVEAK